MRLLQHTLTGTGCDVAWIYHIYEGRDSRAQEVQRTSITELELSRVMRGANMRIRIDRQGSVFSATVVWARSGRWGMTIQDESGHWEGMPEKIEAGEPIFRDEAHAQNAYQLLHTVRQPGSAQEMRDAWVAEVRARKSGGTTITDEER